MAPLSTDTYRVLRELGSRVEGTHAAIRGGHELVVVQRFKRSVPDRTEAILRDARCVLKHWHPNVARVRHVDVVGDELLVATDLIDGVTLAELLVASPTKAASDALLPPPVVVRILLDVLAGLQNMHGMRDPSNELLGAFHGAVCPTNIVVGKDGVARLIATFRPRPVKVTTSSESLCYGAPEAVEELGEAHPGSDLYACGVMLWEALQGKRLFEEKHPSQILQRQREGEIPWVAEPGTIRARIGPVVLKALAFEPALRFRSAGELATALRAVAATDIATGSRVAQRVVERAGDRIRARRAELDQRVGPKVLAEKPSGLGPSAPTPAIPFAPTPVVLRASPPVVAPAPPLAPPPAPIRATAMVEGSVARPSAPPVVARPIVPAEAPVLAIAPSLVVAPSPPPPATSAPPEPVHVPAPIATQEAGAEAPVDARAGSPTPWTTDTPSTEEAEVTLRAGSHRQAIPLLKRGIPLKRAVAIIATAAVVTMMGIVLVAASRRRVVEVPTVAANVQPTPVVGTGSPPERAAVSAAASPSAPVVSTAVRPPATEPSPSTTGASTDRPAPAVTVPPTPATEPTATPVAVPTTPPRTAPARKTPYEPLGI